MNEYVNWEFIDFPNFEKMNIIHNNKNDGEYILVSDFVHTDISYECISVLQYQKKLFSSVEDRNKQFEIDAPRNIIRVNGKKMKYNSSSLDYLEWAFEETKRGFEMAVESCTQAILAYPFFLLNEHLVDKEYIPLDCAGSRVCVDISTEDLGCTVQKTFKMASMDKIQDFEPGSEKDWKNVHMTVMLPDCNERDADIGDVMYLSNIIY